MRGMLLAMAFATAALALPACGSEKDEPSDPVRAPTGRCPGWPRFEPYDVGASFGGLQRTHAEETCGGSPPYAKDPALGAFSSTSYGDCEPPEGEGGCTEPMEIQSRPLCDRQAHLEPGPKRRFAIRGARAVQARGGTVEVYTGRTAVSVAGDDATRNLRAARALRPLKGSPERRLRPPDRAELRREPVCRFRGTPVDELPP